MADEPVKLTYATFHPEDGARIIIAAEDGRLVRSPPLTREQILNIIEPLLPALR